MSRTWVYSDPHFYHKNIVKFTNDDGSKLRPWDDVETMTEEMIQWYNESVQDQDRVYILGDVAFTVANIRRCVSRLKGRKCLVLGNHDPKGLKKYIDLFDDVRGYVQRNGFVMSHIPIHEGSLSRWKVNIHGHTHANRVTIEQETERWNRMGLPCYDKRYYPVSVEHTNFRPKDLEEILSEVGLKT